MAGSTRTVGRIVIVTLGGVLAVAVGYLLFVALPGSLAELLGVVLALALAVVAVKIAANVAGSLFPAYDVAEVSVEGPITRDGGGGPLPTTPGGTPADDVVEEIDRADEDDSVEALLVHLNTPGGEVVPSDDIREAAREFDGPTIAYTDDLCASGGMWIASGCDELWVRDASIVGSIGVRFSQLRFDEFADRHGISYEGIVSGEYKDAVSAPFKELEDDERAYLQELSDSWYEQFVDRVAEGRDLDPDAVRETEARVYLGTDAVEMGLADRIGDRDDVEDRVADELGVEEVTVEPFEPERSLPERLQSGAATLAYAAGAGIASVVDERPTLR